LYEWLTARENIAHVGELHGMPLETPGPLTALRQQFEGDQTPTKERTTWHSQRPVVKKSGTRKRTGRWSAGN
jgi:hypothetical protein